MPVLRGETCHYEAHHQLVVALNCQLIHQDTRRHHQRQHRHHHDRLCHQYSRPQCQWPRGRHCGVRVKRQELNVVEANCRNTCQCHSVSCFYSWTGLWLRLWPKSSHVCKSGQNSGWISDFGWICEISLNCTSFYSVLKHFVWWCHYVVLFTANLPFVEISSLPYEY